MHILLFLRTQALVWFIFLFTIKVCRWYAGKTSYHYYYFIREKEKTKGISLQEKQLRRKSIPLNKPVSSLRGRKQRWKETTFTAEWAFLPNKLVSSTSFVLYFDTKSTLIDGLHLSIHHLYATTCKIHYMSVRCENRTFNDYRKHLD